MNMSLKPPVLAAVLGVAVLWYLSQRKAAAAGLPTFGATPASNATNRAGYNLSPGGAVQGNAGVTNNPAVALIQAAAGLFGGNRNSSNAAATVSLLPGQIYRAPDYSPTAIFDNAGEAAAQSYYAAHQDAFIAQPVDYGAIDQQPWVIAALNDPTEY